MLCKHLEEGEEGRLENGNFCLHLVLKICLRRVELDPKSLKMCLLCLRNKWMVPNPG